MQGEKTLQKKDSHLQTKQNGLGRPFPPWSSKKPKFANILISSFKPPELWENKYIFLKPTQSMVLLWKP